MKREQQSNPRETIWRVCHSAAILLLMVGLSIAVQAASGDVDLHFGAGGIVVTSITDSANHYDEPNSMLVQPDGKIVVCGMVQYFDDETGTGYTVSYFLARYNPTGTLDDSFGTNGKVVAPIGYTVGGTYVGQNIALQEDGKILAVGFHADYNESFAVRRYNPDGTLDAAFGTNGTVHTFGPGGGAYDVAVQPDGKIIVIGAVQLVTGQGVDFAVVRYNPNGSLDTSFGAGDRFPGPGRVVTPVGNGAASDFPKSVALQPDGKIVVVGTSSQVGVGGFALVRYNPDGSLDSGFGANGKIIQSLTNNHEFDYEIASDVAVQPDGKIVVVGDTRFGSAIVRYNADGSLDSSFAATGIFSTDSNFFLGRSIVLQPDGKIVAFGEARIGEGGFAVVRLYPNGSLDASFGSNGRVMTPIAGGGATAGALQPDGKILAFGETGLLDVAIVRYLGDTIASSCTSPNPIDCPDFFVGQHYLDFLNRRSDAGGQTYWTNQITLCGNDAGCVHGKRIDVSASFFIEQEFQDTGYYVYRLYKASFGRPPSYGEFSADRVKVIGGSNLGASKQAFADEWVQRAAFVAAYPITLSNTEVVNKLFDLAGLTAAVYDASQQQEIQALNAGRSRALVLRDVIEIADFKNIPDPNSPRYGELKQISQFNPAFVLMQYFGYLRRDQDQAGYDFWLDVVNNREPNNYRGMVCSFITSAEYQLRFGATVTRSNADCGQ